MSNIESPITTSDQLHSSDGNDNFGINVGEQIEARMEAPIAQVQEHSRYCNVGLTEQKFRIAAGTALIATAAFAPLSRGWRIGLAAFGIAELITGATRYCPVSRAFGINTCRDGE
jgi:hypothetical protein